MAGISEENTGVRQLNYAEDILNSQLERFRN